MNILPYLGILTAAAIEGEVVYVSAVVMASLGKLDITGVLVSGAIGGWVGDQFWFYAARGHLSSWLNRFNNIKRRSAAIEQRMQRHANKFILAVRFLPGIRIAVTLACAYSGVSAIQFSGLSFISAIAWASAIMSVVLLFGPASLSALGLKAWWAPAIPAILILVFFRWLARVPPTDVPPAQ